MDHPDLNITNLKKLKVFFEALKKSNYRPQLIPSYIDIAGVRTPVDRNGSLELLHSLPNLKDKNPNQIIQELSNPIKVSGILSQFHPAERNELMEIMAEKPLHGGAGSIESAAETTSAQAEPVGAAVGGESASSMTGGGDHPATSSHLPNLNTSHLNQPQHFNRPQTYNQTQNLGPATNKANKLEAQQITGTGTAVTQKAERLEAAKQAPPVPKAFEKAFQNEPEYKTNPTISPKPENPTPKITTHAPKPEKIASLGQNPGLRFKTGPTNTLKNIANKAGTFLQRNAGKYVTVGRAASAVGAVVGGFAGAGLTGGASVGVFAGAVGGGILPSWVQSGGGGRFFRNVGNGTVNTFSRLTNPAGGGGGNFFRGGKGLKKGFAQKRLIWLFIGMILLFGIFAGILGGLSGGQPVSTGNVGVGTATDISACSFTQAGEAKPVKSTTLQQWIVSAAAQAGVPSQVLASIARHESPDFVANADDNHDSIKSGQYCHPGSPVCVDMSKNQTAHTGICTDAELSGNFKTAYAMGLMQNLDIYNQDKGDLCNIQNSLKIAATKLKTDGLTTQPTDDQINTAVSKYYGQCSYGSYNYCGEVLKDYQNCQASTVSPANPTTPTGNFVYYCEADPRYSDSCHNPLAICGPTSVAMVVDTLTGSTLNPKDIDTTFISNGWRSCGSAGSSMGPALDSPWFSSLNLRAIQLNFQSPLDLQKAATFLKSGALIIGSVEPHIFVVDQVDVTNNKVHLRDPDPGNTNQCQDPNGYWRDNNTPWISTVSGGYPWYYAYAIQKVEQKNVAK